MVDVVLIHGTTQTSAGFRDLVPALGRRGHRAVAVDVAASPATGAAGHAELIADQLPPDLDRPLVAGHSAAGLLLPAVARRLHARHQVWMAAAVHDVGGGRSFRAEVRADPVAVMGAEWLAADFTGDPVAAAYFLFHDADFAALQRALPTVRAGDLAAVYDEVPDLDPAGVGSTYLLPAADRTLLPAWMARAARDRLGVEPVVLPGAAHNFYAADPDGTAELISAAALG